LCPMQGEEALMVHFLMFHWKFPATAFVQDRRCGRRRSRMRFYCMWDATVHRRFSL
jgi:hypothetical protein